jgi:sulfur-oxidizing protein SoxZ
MDIFGRPAIRLPSSYRKGEVIEVKTRLNHPNYNGRRKYMDLGYNPAHYVETLEAFYGEERVLVVQCTGAISQNPYFVFALRVTHSAPVKVIWKDTKGQKFEETVQVQV